MSDTTPVPGGKDDREAIHEVLQTHSGVGREGAVLTGWVVITEWADGQSRWLARSWAPGTTDWTAKGMIHEVLHGDGWGGSGEES
jgi:hypothetical protein